MIIKENGFIKKIDEITKETIWEIPETRISENGNFGDALAEAMYPDYNYEDYMNRCLKTRYKVGR